MVEVDPETAFADPTKFVGRATRRSGSRTRQSQRLAVKPDGGSWRRVVASPEPKRIFELAPITWLIEKGAVVICRAVEASRPRTCPTARHARRRRTVIDKDFASELLARELGADLFVMASDEGGVLDWGTPEQTMLGWVTPEELARHEFPAASMGPKVEAARDSCSTVEPRRDRSPRRHRAHRRRRGGTNIVAGCRRARSASCIVSTSRLRPSPRLRGRS